MSEQKLARIAEKCLVGVGDAALGEWKDWTGTAYHIRRRLSAREQKIVGDVKDIRNTQEAIERLRKISQSIPQRAKDLAVQELGLLRYPI